MSTKDQNISVTKTIAITFTKTAILLVSAFFFFMAVCVCLSPRTAISIYEFLGAEKGVVGGYEQIYKQSGKNIDLYNLIQKSATAGTYKTTSKYITILQKKDNYKDFVAAVDKAVRSASSKKYVAYVGDLDGYLTSQKVLAEYKRGNKTNAKKLALADLNNDNIYSFALSTYVDCVLNDSKLLNTKRVEIVSGLLSDEVKLLLDGREESLDYKKGDLNEIDKILMVYTLLKIENFKYTASVLANEKDTADSILEYMKNLQKDFDTFIAS